MAATLRQFDLMRGDIFAMVRYWLTRHGTEEITKHPETGQTVVEPPLDANGAMTALLRYMVETCIRQMNSKAALAELHTSLDKIHEEMTSRLAVPNPEKPRIALVGPDGKPPAM